MILALSKMVITQSFNFFSGIPCVRTTRVAELDIYRGETRQEKKLKKRIEKPAYGSELRVIYWPIKPYTKKVDCSVTVLLLPVKKILKALDTISWNMIPALDY